jgi:hypothetical protein
VVNAFAMVLCCSRHMFVRPVISMDQLETEATAEHDCRHPGGLADRMLCVLYRSHVDPGPVLLVPQVARRRVAAG